MSVNAHMAATRLGVIMLPCPNCGHETVVRHTRFYAGIMKKRDDKSTTCDSLCSFDCAVAWFERAAFWATLYVVHGEPGTGDYRTTPYTENGALLSKSAGARSLSYLSNWRDILAQHDLPEHSPHVAAR